MPSRVEVLIGRLRAVWQRLRSLPQARARALSKQRHPAYNRATAQPLQVIAPASVDATVAVPTPTVIGSANVTPLHELYEMWIGQYRDGMMHLSDQEFVAWLSQQRHAFEHDVDQQVAAWRQTKAYRQAEAWRRRAEAGGAG
jgi:hypothetical protein